MNLNPWIIILVTHLILSLVLVVLVFSKKSALRKELIIPIIMIPFFGPVFGIMIEWIHRSGKEGRNIDLIMPQTEEDDIIWHTIKNDQENSDIIPLEEALLIDEPDVRRRIMLKALYDDPLKYLDVLMVAAHNNDGETAHYATTTIAHQQRKFQIEIQKISAAYEKDPENELLLDEYIEQIEAYIESGLLEEYLLNNQRIVYSQALAKKVSLNPTDQKSLVKLLKNSIDLKHYGRAFEISEQLKQEWPHEESTWTEALRACVEGKDRKKLLETLQEMQIQTIQWTRQGKESLHLWTEGAK